MSRSRKRKTKSGTTDIFSLIVSIVCGTLWMIVGGAAYNLMNLYNILSGKLSPALIMAMYFGGLALTLFLAALICNGVKGYKKPKKDDYKKALITVLVIVIAAGVFQIIYSLDIKTTKKDEATSYAFLIDDSTSMDYNDPENLRYEAIKAVMKKASQTKQFSVYSFHTYCNRMTDMMSAYEAENMSFDIVTAGDTRIVNALNTVLEDVKNGTVNLGRGGRIILLTDGCTTELFSALALRNTLTALNDRGISVSTIGFGACDDDYLQNIADMTNGKFVRAQDASQLASAMLTATEAKSDYNRNLINHRNPVSSWVEYLYGFERMVFIILLGVAFIYLKSLLLRSNDSSSNLLLAHIIIIAIGALGIEIGMNIFYWSETLMRLIMCVCFTLIFVTQSRTNATYCDGYDAYGSRKENKFSVGNDDSLYDDIYS